MKNNTISHLCYLFFKFKNRLFNSSCDNFVSRFPRMGGNFVRTEVDFVFCGKSYIDIYGSIYAVGKNEGFAKVELAIKSRNRGKYYAVSMRRNNLRNIQGGFQGEGKKCVFEVRIAFNELDSLCRLKDDFLDFYLLLERQGSSSIVPLRGVSKAFMSSPGGRNLKVYRDVSKGQIVYLYFNHNVHTLTLVCRKPYCVESFKYRAKQFVCYMYFFLMYQHFSKKNIWLMHETYCESAQDNAACLFKYIRECYPQKQVYYVLDKQSKDFVLIKDYEKWVVDYYSFKHLLFALSAKLLISSHSKWHLLGSRYLPPVDSQHKSILSNKDFVFLQHGVTGFKKSNYHRNSFNRASKVVASSNREVDIICSAWGYERDDVLLSGMPRFDYLVDSSLTNEVTNVLVAPTWRQWLADVDDAEFVESEFFNTYRNLLSSQYAKHLIKQRNVKFVFYLHIRMKQYIQFFFSTIRRLRLSFLVKPQCAIFSQQQMF